MRNLVGRGNFVALGVLVLCVILTSVNIHQLRRMQADFMSIQPLEVRATGDGDEEQRSALSLAQRPKFTVFGKNIDSGYLKHVYAVLDRAGYVRVNHNLTDDWSVMWAHDYPFTKIKPALMKMKKHQKVNKLPGSGYVTNKVNLATSSLPNIPKAFKIPEEVSVLRAAARLNPEKMYVQKNKNHRGIKIEKIENLDLKSQGSFVQEFVDDPFLIDGYKFDIGVYTMITSMDPLRIYVFEGDVLLRFCPEKYHPFDAANRDKYVVHDDYRPTWKVPTMAKYYSDLGYSFKETLNAHVRSLGKDPDMIWSGVYDTIRAVYKAKQKDFVAALNRYPHKRAFFEMVRFDFVVGSNMQLYLMEANMSPNLSSKHFALNRRLYEQVVYSLLRLTGVVRGGLFSASLQPGSEDETEMQVCERDLHVFPDECASKKCSLATSCEQELECRLCKQCLSSDDLENLRLAFLEHSNRHLARRILPEPMTFEESENWRDAVAKVTAGDDGSEQIREVNSKMTQWFAGKCLMDRNWCD